MILQHNICTSLKKLSRSQSLNVKQSSALNNWIWNCFFRSKASDILKHRRVVHFGYNFNYDTNGVDEHSDGSQIPPPIPQACFDWFLNGMVGEGRIPELPDQLTVNVYAPGM